MSPAIHNAAFAASAMDAVYLPLRVEKVEEFIKAFRSLGVQGYSVTIPHKEAAIKAVDEVDSFVRQIGALNTIVVRNGRLCGYNTDWLAAITAIEKAMTDAPAGNLHLQSAIRNPQSAISPLRGKRVAVLGAGGTARALAFGLRHRDATTYILNRTVERAERLAKEVGCQWGPIGHLGRLEYDVLANTTSVGMHPKVDETPVPAELLRKGLVVFDAVYNPPATRLLREAEAAGCITVSGVDMFVSQAVAQFEMWTGRPAPVEVMREVVMRRLTGRG
jgi:3-dehydroquinate dehydratase/shikimate dehydrogenase